MLEIDGETWEDLPCLRPIPAKTYWPFGAWKSGKTACNWSHAANNSINESLLFFQLRFFISICQSSFLLFFSVCSFIPFRWLCWRWRLNLATATAAGQKGKSDWNVGAAFESAKGPRGEGLGTMAKTVGSLSAEIKMIHSVGLDFQSKYFMKVEYSLLWEKFVKEYNSSWVLIWRCRSREKSK